MIFKLLNVRTYKELVLQHCVLLGRRLLDWSQKYTNITIEVVKISATYTRISDDL